MTEQSGFIEQGLQAVRLALTDIAAKANLHLKPETLTRSLKRRCMAQFRMLATLIRRLVFLMALALDVVPPQPEPEKAYPRPEGVEEGVADVTASFGPQGGGLRLAPAISGAFPETVRCASGVSAGPVSAVPVLARWAALQRVLEQPAEYAVRLAFTLARWRTAGEPCPVILPQPGLHRFGADLGLVAGLLPDLLARALAEAWDTS